MPNLRAGSRVWALFKEQQVLLTGEPTLPPYCAIFVKGIFRYLFTYLFYSFNFLMCMFAGLSVCLEALLSVWKAWLSLYSLHGLHKLRNFGKFLVSPSITFGLINSSFQVSLNDDSKKYIATLRVMN